MKPLCIDLFCGLGGWTEGFLAEGYRVVGFDIERHVYGDARYPAQLVLQDVLTLDGAQFKDADCIVASPPCQNYSYLAMPWSRSKSEHSQAAKALRRKWETEGPDNRLFDACFRIQREASAAAGRHIPLIVENVRGAIPWVGRSVWHHGSFHLWGDVPALMPITIRRPMNVPGFRFDGSGRSFQTASVKHTEVKGFGGGWFENKQSGAMGPSRNPREFLDATGIKGTNGVGGDAPAGTGGNSWFFGKRADPRDLRRDPVTGEWVRPDGTTLGEGKLFTGGLVKGVPYGLGSQFNSRSQARKAASAQIAKIPLALSQHIASVYHPQRKAA